MRSEDRFRTGWSPPSGGYRRGNGLSPLSYPRREGVLGQESSQHDSSWAGGRGIDEH